MNRLLNFLKALLFDVQVLRTLTAGALVSLIAMQVVVRVQINMLEQRVHQLNAAVGKIADRANKYENAAVDLSISLGAYQSRFVEIAGEWTAHGSGAAAGAMASVGPDGARIELAGGDLTQFFSFDQRHALWHAGPNTAPLTLPTAGLGMVRVPANGMSLDLVGTAMTAVETGQPDGAPATLQLKGNGELQVQLPGQGNAAPEPVAFEIAAQDADVAGAAPAGAGDTVSLTVLIDARQAPRSFAVFGSRLLLTGAVQHGEVSLRRLIDLVPPPDESGAE